MTLTVRGIGEQLFIAGCVKAVRNNDNSKVHMLLLKKGKMLYATTEEVDVRCYDLQWRDGAMMIYLCVVSKDLIAKWHEESKRQKRPKKWIMSAVEQRIQEGKQFISEQCGLQV